MSFKYNPLGHLVTTDPAQAFSQLKKLFRTHTEVPAVASSLGADKATVARWLRRLADMGYGDPRDGKRGVAGRRPWKKPASK